jgi:hypothetical protein
MAFDDGYYGSDYDAYSYQAEPQYYNDYEAYSYQPEPQYYNDYADMGAYYPQPAAPAEPAWYETMGKGLGSYAMNNPKDVLGMAIGGGMGLWGLLSQPDAPPRPDLSGVNQANALMQQQLQSTQGLNADAVAKLRGQIGGDYGDYADAAAARQAATAQVQQLMASGPDYTLLPEEERQIAELAQKWSSKNMLGSSLHNAELQQLKSTFTNNALARYQSQLKALQDVSNQQSNQTSTQFANTGNVVNQGESRQIQGLSSLASSGLGAAQVGAQADQAATKLEQDRANQLLKVGGDIFGRSIADPQGDVNKAVETAFRKHQGQTVS